MSVHNLYESSEVKAAVSRNMQVIQCVHIPVTPLIEPYKFHRTVEVQLCQILLGSQLGYKDGI